MKDKKAMKLKEEKENEQEKTIKMLILKIEDLVKLLLFLLKENRTLKEIIKNG
jgi:hypothetical protein